MTLLKKLNRKTTLDFYNNNKVLKSLFHLAIFIFTDKSFYFYYIFCIFFYENDYFDLMRESDQKLQHVSCFTQNIYAVSVKIVFKYFLNVESAS